MCITNTPLEHYPDLGLWVKREDLCCPGGPNFSKTRGVYLHVQKQKAEVIGVLDTDHSQGGWAVAKACNLLGKQCWLFYPMRKHQTEIHHQQLEAGKLRANLIPLAAGRSAILYHRARASLPVNAYMMPNALKLRESVDETAAEVLRTALPDVEQVLISASSGTLAAGVILGLARKPFSTRVRVLVHMGYSRSEPAVRDYIEGYLEQAGEVPGFTVIDEGYAYSDEADPGPVPPFPCNAFYDLKAFRWWVKEGRKQYSDKTLFWNVG